MCDGEKCSHSDLILFFRHQLRVKIRCERKDKITLDKRWVYTVSLVIRKGATLESFFTPLPEHGDDGLGPSVPHPPISRISCTPLLSSYLFEVCHLPHHLVVSFQDLPHPPFFYHLKHPPVTSFWGSWTPITVIHVTHSSLLPLLRFFYPISLHPPSPIGIVRLFFFAPLGNWKTVCSPHHRRGDWRVTKRGFILVFTIFRWGHFPHQCLIVYMPSL